MKYTVKAFGIAKDIVGGKEIVVEEPEQTVAALRTRLVTSYPQLAGLKSLMIAVNNSYAEDADVIRENDEIALIPPVSGG
jgi:molybdopterin converting factor subunit 1